MQSVLWTETRYKDSLYIYAATVFFLTLQSSKEMGGSWGLLKYKTFFY